MFLFAGPVALLVSAVASTWKGRRDARWRVVRTRLDARIPQDIANPNRQQFNYNHDLLLEGDEESRRQAMRKILRPYEVYEDDQGHGPDPERVKIEGDWFEGNWEDAIKKALEKARPAEGWPDGPKAEPELEEEDEESPEP